MRYLDVCSGYSATTLGWAGLGFQCVGYSEIEPFPRAILEQRHGAVAVDWDHRWHAGSNTTPLFGDFTRIMPEHVGPVDLLVGGTPCQAFSVAGKRLGLDDPRGNLTLEFLALARRLRVPWLVWENVPGVLSHDEGRTLGTFLGLLGQLGYGWAYRVLDAQYIRVDGHARAIPQRRRRVFVVGHLGDSAGPAAVLFERESLRGHPAPRREARQGAAPTLSARTRGCGGLGTDFECDGGLVPQGFGGGNTQGPISSAACLTAKGQRVDFEVETFIAQPIAASLTRGAESAGKGGYAGRRQEDDVNLVAHALRAEGFDASEDGTGRGTPIVPVHHFQTRGSNIDFGQEVAGTIGQNCDRASGGAPAVAFSVRSREGEPQAEPAPDGLAPSLRTTGGGSSHAFLATEWAVRRLTPTECERLMGVPDGFTAITYRGKPAADGPRYKALGNSMAVNCMRWIGHGIAEVNAAQNARKAAA